MRYATSRIEESQEHAPGSFNPLKPMKAVLTDVRDENSDVKTYRLKVGDGFSRSAAAGQFNMLGYPGIGEAPISFSGIGEDGEIEHTIRAVGMATRFIERMRKGSEMLIRGPYGRGWPLGAAKGKDLLLVAGGVGLAPIRPVIRQIMKNRADFGEVTLLIGSRNDEGLIFTNEYSAWQKAMSVEITVDELVTKKPWNYRVGLITALLNRVKMKAENAVAFICGPELMMRFICRALLLKGAAAGSLSVSLERRMRCGIAQCGHCQHVGFFVCRDGPVFPYKQVEGLFDGLL